MAWAGALRRGARTDQVLELAERVTSLGSVEELGNGEAVPGRPRRFTTRQVLELEARAVEIATHGVGVGAPTVALTAAPGLSAEQDAMVRHVCERPDRVVCAVGLAGAGKTTATTAVATNLVEAGLPVFAVAPSGVAAERLGDEIGHRATTIHRLLIEQRRLPERSVVIVDEAGMADTRSLAELLERIERAQGKAILIGDPHQLQSVGPGGLFPELVERLGAAELHVNRRQLDPERRLLADVRAGEPLAYLAHGVRDRRIQVADDLTQARDQLTRDWWTHGREDPERNLMLAYRRADVRELNAGAHHLMDQLGALGMERLTTPSGEELAAGDRVICHRNDPSLGVTNGTRGVITTIDPHHQEIGLTTDRGTQVRLPAGYIEQGHLQLGYAITGHASQGITVDRAFVLATPQGPQREWGYVALSRAKRETRLYVASTDLELDDLTPADGPGPLARLTRSLETPAAEPLALRQRRQPEIELEP